MMSGCFAAGQERDSLLARMNDVKLSVGAYLYGVCTSPDVTKSETGAVEQLFSRVEAFVKESGFTHIVGLQDVKKEDVFRIDCEVQPGIYRVMFYLEKRLLAELEQVRVSSAISVDRKTRDALLRQMSAFTRVDQIDSLIAAPDIKQQVQMIKYEGINTPQEYVDQGYLVYYDSESGKILELMTPRDNNGNRKSLRTGELVNPLRFRMVPLLIIFKQ